MKRPDVLAGLACVAAALVIWWWRSEPPPPSPGTASSPPTRLETVSASQPIEEPRSTSPAASPASNDKERSWKLLREMERALVSLDERERDRAYTQLLPELLASNPAAVARLVEQCPPGPVRQELLSHVARTWTTTSSSGAIEWVSKLKDEAERVSAASEVTAQIARSDPASAIEVSDLLGIGRDNGAVEHTAQIWATADLEGALKWVQQQPPGPQRDQLMARVLAVQAETQGASAAETALNEITPGAVQDAVVTAVLRQWAYRDLDGALAWVEALEDDELRKRAKSELTRVAQQVP